MSFSGQILINSYRSVSMNLQDGFVGRHRKAPKLLTSSLSRSYAATLQNHDDRHLRHQWSPFWLWHDPFPLNFHQAKHCRSLSYYCCCCCFSIWNWNWSQIFSDHYICCRELWIFSVVWCSSHFQTYSHFGDVGPKMNLCRVYQGFLAPFKNVGIIFRIFWHWSNFLRFA